MEIAKTRFTYITQFLGTAVTCAFLFVLFTRISDLCFGLNGTVLFSFLEIDHLAAFGAVLVAAGLFYLLRLIGTKIPFSEKGVGLFLGVYALIAIGCGTFYFGERLFSEGGGFSVYDNAVKIFDGVRPSGDLFEKGFTWIAWFFLKVFGIDQSVFKAIVIGLFVLSSVFFFIAISSVFGLLSGSVSVSFLAFSWVYARGPILESANIFVWLILSFAFMILGLVLKDRQEGLMKSNANLILFGIIGALFGFVAYSEIGLVLIVPILAFALFFNDTKSNDPAVNRRTAPFVVFTVTFILSLAASLILTDISGFPGIIIDRFAMIRVSMEHTVIPSYVFDFAPDLGNCLGTNDILVFVLWGFLGALNHSSDITSLPFIGLILSGFVMLFTNVYGISPAIVFAVIGVLAAAGFKSLFARKLAVMSTESQKTSDNSDEDSAKTEGGITVIEPENPASFKDVFGYEAPSELAEDQKEKAEEPSKEEIPENAESAGELANPETEKRFPEKEEVPEPVEDIVLVLEDEEKTSAVEPSSEEPVSEEPAKEKVVLFENILPMPKKHVKKEISYDYDVPDGKLEYDYAVGADDDFDI